MIQKKIEIYPDVSAIGDRLAEFLYKSTEQRISFVLSGGDTPRKIFNHLGKNHASLPWHNIDFFWGDERCVPPDHPESNYLMAKMHLFDTILPGSSNIHRIHGEDKPETEIPRYRKEIFEFVQLENQKPVFDVMMLGVGEDGHTASIFPDQLHLLYSENICELAIHPQTGRKRITLTGPVIKMAKNILFIATGKNKSDIISRIILNKEGSENLPACLISPENGQLFWLLDREASSDL